ncbi:MAG: CHC2 zinc finger domain-containing protein [Verrucomicrobiales bacterium]|nr:CHC2 zinc finger domain-containing protein [Verrucomicrobiales bacterium]
MTIEQAKQRLLLPKLARLLGIPSRIPDKDGQSVPCFWPDRHKNGDRNPSFNFHDNLSRYYCHGCGMSGDGPDLIASFLSVSPEEAISRFIKMAGGESKSFRPASKSKVLKLPSDFSGGKEENWSRLARLRRVSVEAVSLVVGMQVVGFGSVCKNPSWIITDEMRIVAEARRLDGKLFSAIGQLQERKAHTLAGSRKCWPVGLLPKHSNPALFRKILVCEGGPDLLAAYHFCLHFGVHDALPVSMLGRSISGLHPDALKRFEGKRVRIFPHADPDGGGVDAAKGWKEQIENAGASKVDAFNFSGLIRKDSKPVTDLNDCTVICRADEVQLEGLLP